MKNNKALLKLARPMIGFFLAVLVFEIILFELLAKELQRSGTPGRKPDVKICSACGMPMKKRTGRYGEFWGCTGYPACRHTENVF